MTELVGEGLLLLTSSPVHGLANSSSDLDFIRIHEEPTHGPRISIKIFECGHHLEVVSFSHAELTAGLEELEGLAALAPGQTVAGLRRWDSTREPRRKQTERIVNGITLAGAAPYLPSLPALATVWCRASIELAIQQATHLALAEAAGERRGRVGYAYNVLLHLMDAMLSFHGDVYTTRKWYLLRWNRLVAAGNWRDEACAAVAEELERLRRQVNIALTNTAGRHGDLTADYTALALATARATGTADAVCLRVECTGGAGTHPFLPGAWMLTTPGAAVVLSTPTLPLTTQASGIAELAGITPPQATSLLRALRAGAARLRIDYGNPKDDNAEAA